MSAPGITLRPEWLDWPQTQGLIRLFGHAPMVFHGGAVRDALLGIAPNDIDIMLDMPRERIVDGLEHSGFAIVSNGLGAMDIVACKDGCFYEIFYAHPEDRRSATAILSRRPDFLPNDLTINALYLTPEGALLDPCGGADDLKAGRVRFAGDARTRIMEQPDRIIRFFRFHARYGKGDPDPEALALCAACAHYLANLHTSIMDRYMFYLLREARMSPMLELMRQRGILDPVFGFTIHDCRRLAMLETLESMTQSPPDAHLRLCVLLLHASLPPLEGLARIRRSWGLPDDSYEWKYNLLAALPEAKPGMAVAMQDALRERLGAYAYKQLLLLAWVMEPEPLAARAAYEVLLAVP